MCKPEFPHDRKSGPSRLIPSLPCSEHGPSGAPLGGNASRFAGRFSGRSAQIESAVQQRGAVRITQSHLASSQQNYHVLVLSVERRGGLCDFSPPRRVALSLSPHRHVQSHPPKRTMEKLTAEFKALAVTSFGDQATGAVGQCLPLLLLVRDRARTPRGVVTSEHRTARSCRLTRRVLTPTQPSPSAPMPAARRDVRSSSKPTCSA